METVITGKKPSLIERIREVSRFKELLYFFIWRDIKVRYKQTVLGILWVIIQPVILVVIFSYIFSAFRFGESTGIPYAVLAFIGVFFWLLFSNIVSSVGNSIVSNQHIIQKIYFPNILIPLSATAVSIFDAFVMLIVLIGLFAFYGITFLPVFMLMFLMGLTITVIFALGFGLFFGALNVRYRDVRYILPFLLQILFFLSPVIYTLSQIPDRFSSLLRINPLFAVINNVRSGLVGQDSIIWSDLGLSFVIALIVSAIGVLVFNSLETQFSDLM